MRRLRMVLVGGAILSVFVTTAGITAWQFHLAAEAERVAATAEWERLVAEAPAVATEVAMLVSQAGTDMAAGKLDDARTKLASASARLKPYFGTDGSSIPRPILDIPCTADGHCSPIEDLARTVATELAKVRDGKRAEKEERTRRVDVATGLVDADRIVADKALCVTPVKIVDAWKKLRRVVPADPEFARAKIVAKKLDACRKASEKVLNDGLRDIMVKQREEMAARMEGAMLDEGMDVRVSLGGVHKTSLTIKWILMGRPLVYKLTKDGTYLAKLENIGFKRVTFTDGYESVYYDLSPSPEDRGGADALASMGLGEPLRLPPPSSDSTVTATAPAKAAPPLVEDAAPNLDPDRVGRSPGGGRAADVPGTAVPRGGAGDAEVRDLDKDDVASAVRDAKGKLRACSAEESIKVRVFLVVSGSGVVASAGIGAPYNGTPIGECVAAIFMSARFPALGKESPAIEYTVTVGKSVAKAGPKDPFAD